MENVTTQISQSIGTNNGTANATKGNIQSFNNVIQNESQDIVKLINSVKELINCQDIEGEVKEEVIDDLETIEEQITTSNPKHVKLKKAYQGLRNFIASIPDKIAYTTLFVSKCNELVEKIKPLIENR